MIPEQIVHRYGYDPEILGKNHLEGLQYTIKKAALEGNPFGNIMRPNLAREKGDNKIDTPHTDIKRLEQTITYLEQEIEYLKKNFFCKNFQEVGAVFMKKASAIFEIIESCLQEPEINQALNEKYNLVCPIRRINPYRQLAKELQTNTVAGNLLLFINHTRCIYKTNFVLCTE